MVHMRISGTEPLSVILSQTYSLKIWMVMNKKYQKLLYQVKGIVTKSTHA